MSTIAWPMPEVEFNPEVACDVPEEQDPLIRILITEPIAQEGTLLLRNKLPGAEIDERFGLSSEQLRHLIGDYTVLIVRSQTPVTDDLLAAAPLLKIIGCAGAGMDTLDLEAAKRRGILVVNAPRGAAVAVAEHTIAMMLALARHIPVANNSTKAGQWEMSRFVGVELAQKVLGIVGLGKVGKEVAKRAQGLGMQVLASDPHVSFEQASHLGVALLRLEEMLLQSDIVTLHAPLIAGPHGTTRLIGSRELSLLKPGARLINCAHGGLIDEAALLSALREGRLAGMALDVYSQEPIGDDAVLRQLLADTRVIVTPHLAASTAEAQVRVARELAHRIALVLLSERLRATRRFRFPPSLP